jgi:hypothetical protein
MILYMHKTIRILAALTLATLATLGAQVHGQTVASANASFAWANGVAGASGNVPDICTDAGGNCYAVCHFNSTNAMVGTTVLTNSGGYDTFVVKYNSRGQPLWVKQLFGDASDFGLAIALDSAGSVYITGNFYSDVLALDGLSVTNATGTSASDIFIAKFDGNGAAQWLRRFGGNGTDTAFHVVVDRDDNVLITGSFFSTTLDFDTVTLVNASTDSDMFLAKLNPAGDVIWARRGGGPKGDAGYRMVVDANNNCVVTGYFFNSATFGTVNLVSAGSADAYVAKYDGSGNLQWVTSGGGTGVDEAFGLAQDAAGNSYVSGYFNSATASFGGQVIHSAGGNDLFLIKLSPSGTVLWAKSAGGTGDDRGKSVGVDAQGYVYVSGSFSGSATFGSTTLASTGGVDLCLLKYSPAGVLQWVIPATGPADDQGNQITLDRNGHLYVSGSCSSNAVFGALTLTNTLNNTPFLARLDFLPPNINITPTNGLPMLWWTTNFLTPVVAQGTTNLRTWQDLTNAPVLVNGTFAITNLPPASPSFYRLRNLN